MALASIHVVDDETSMRDSLQFLLETAGFSVATYGTATEFLAAASNLAGGCVLTDVRMPELDGLKLQERLAEQAIRLPVILMSGQGEVQQAVRAMKGGAVDFLEKPFPDEQLFAAVGRALSLSRDVQAADRVVSEAARQVSELTPRERGVLALLVAGLSTKAIAARLDASPRTIEVHRARVFGKLGARSLPDLVRLSLAAGLGPGR